jgi:hypothetical protein
MAKSCKKVVENGSFSRKADEYSSRSLKKALFFCLAKNMVALAEDFIVSGITIPNVLQTPMTAKRIFGVAPEPESSSPRSQQPAAGPNPEPGRSTPQQAHLPNIHFDPIYVSVFRVVSFLHCK